MNQNLYSAKNLAKPVHFFFAAPEAKVVSLVGDFNDWNPEAHPMQKRAYGFWFLEVLLPHGHHHYQFVVDGQPKTDPGAMGAVQHGQHGLVSLIAVS